MVYLFRALKKRNIHSDKGMIDPQLQLKRWPMDLIEWPVFNSKRLDVTLVKDWLIPPNNVNVLPADERLVGQIF